MKKLIKYSLLMVPVLLSGCEKDERLSPPLNGKSVSVTVKIPHEIDVLPLGVMYRSNKCFKKRSNSNGESYEVPGFHFTEINLKQIGDSDLFESQVPFDGGGNCQWKLSNVTIGIKYKKNALFESGDVTNVPINEIITFDEMEPQRVSGSYKDVYKELVISGDYYPMMTTYRIKDQSKTLSIVKEIDFIYKMHEADKLFFYPVIHSNLIVKAMEPDKQKVGEYFEVTYPDGVVTSSPYFPDFKKLRTLQ
ncbi:hypothetical protein CBW58_07105 [Yersinia frederiksenii]|nr:hypothetical protein CBW58_07105 [Yersinia frederiksenii]